MNLLIHDLAAAIEREACDDRDPRTGYRPRGGGSWEARRPVVEPAPRATDPASGDERSSSSSSA